MVFKRWDALEMLPQVHDHSLNGSVHNEKGLLGPAVS